MVNFGGWDMPLEYSGILSEHEAVRTRAGLFDVSHMGEIEVRGHAALDLVQWVTCNNAAKLDGRTGAVFRPDDRARHVRRRSAGAQNFRHALPAVRQRRAIRTATSTTSSRRIELGADVENAGPRYSQLAVQGPRAKEILQQLTPVPLDPIRYYHFTFGKVSGVDCLIARTGYTGEDGFEIYFEPEFSEKLWDDLLQAGEPFGMIPCGLGARNTLRLEAAMCLYGHEIDETTTPLEAGLGWICKLEKGRFLGCDVIAAQKQAGIEAQARRLRNARQAHRTRRLSRPDCRARSGPRHQRRPGAVSEEEYRHGLRAARIERRGHRNRNRHSRPSRRRRASSRCLFTSGLTKRLITDSGRSGMYPADYRYTKEHEWIKVEGPVGTIGITDYAQQRTGRRGLRRAAQGRRDS